MKGIVFKDNVGNVLSLAWNADAKNFPPSANLPEGYVIEEITEEDGMKLFSYDGKGRRLIDPIEDRVKRVKEENELLKEILEEELKHPKGYYQERIKDRLKKRI